MKKETVWIDLSNQKDLDEKIKDYSAFTGKPLHVTNNGNGFYEIPKNELEQFEDCLLLLKLPYVISPAYETELVMGEKTTCFYDGTFEAAVKRFEELEQLEQLYSSVEPAVSIEMRSLKDTSVVYRVSGAYRECKTKQNGRSVYFDMDGTLARWYPDGKGLSYPEQILDPVNHYYRNLEPISYTVDLAKRLSEKGIDVCVISAADSACVKDKRLWLEEYCPFIPKENIFFCPLGTDKTRFVKGNADKSVLIDDYNPNLSEWKSHGGTAVKLLNGINSKNTSYKNLDIFNTPPEKAVQLLTTVLERGDKITERI
jgi:5'(3')-deoxyribonucleotidase